MFDFSRLGGCLVRCQALCYVPPMRPAEWNPVLLAIAAGMAGFGGLLLSPYLLCVAAVLAVLWAASFLDWALS